MKNWISENRGWLTLAGLLLALSAWLGAILAGLALVAYKLTHL